MANFGIPIKVHFNPIIPLKREYFCQKNFAVIIPSCCETVEDVKHFLVSEFCAGEITDRLDIRVDSVFSLRDKDSIQVIKLFSDKDKTFECLFDLHMLSTTSTCSTCTSSSLMCVLNPQKYRFRTTIDEVDSSGITVEPFSFSQPSSSVRIPTPTKRRAEEELAETDEVEMDEGENQNSGQTFVYPDSVQGAPKKATVKSKSDETPDVVDENAGQPTRSAKRRERLRRSVVKRLCLTPKEPPIDSEHQNKENEMSEQSYHTPAADREETGSELTSTTPQSGNANYPRRRILRSAKRSINKTPSRPRGSPQNSSYTFVSEILQNKETPDPEQVSVQGQVGYENLPNIEGIDDIKVQDVIAFKVWELEAGGPCQSDYKEARVVGIDMDNGRLTLEYIKGAPDAEDESAVDGYVADDSLGCSTDMDFKRFIDPKHLTSNSKAEEEFTLVAIPQ